MEHEKYFQYFDRAVLNFYRTNSQAYNLTEDDMGGQIKISRNWNEEMEEIFPYIELKFAFRKLENKVVCLGVFMPSFKDKTSEKDISKWQAFLLTNPKFNKENNEFNRWVDRYINGSWEVDDGPKVKINRELKLINSLTKIKLGKVLFKHEEYRLLNYPIAENNEEYTKSILELYRFLIDGMEKDCIENLATFKNINLTDSKKRLNSLKEILPEKLRNIIHKPFSEISQKRMTIHGIPSKDITTYPAFENFNNDLKSINNSLVHLKEWLEKEFNLDSKSCQKRLESLTLFPQLNKPPRPEFKLFEAQKMVGKTIERIEFGEKEFDKNLHLSEAINLFFTDGTSTTIQIGSNASNISDKYDNISPSNIHTDIMIFWADRIKKLDE
jgi:hypothetical protein